MPTIYSYVVMACWAAFLLYWGYSALSMKRTLHNPATGWGFAVRIAILVVVIAIVHFAAPTVSLRPGFEQTSPLLAMIGDACAVVGITFAIWARYTLGRNWGMPMSVKEKPELVTSGPYALVRHPIYTGVLLALLGSTFVVGLWWLIIFAVGTIYFLYSAAREEALMMKEFPNEYPAYKARTKMLIPLIC
ncbi:MAG TPA: isoprenylcysteine carboxylmethyltransferase family protein [Candidatus Paceibacterota bacterium]|nr:isoprenylcysteine carboxylmethyltransferase family protein [Candidatus Paceibacterota bacterium]